MVGMKAWNKTIFTVVRFYFRVVWRVMVNVIARPIRLGYPVITEYLLTDLSPAVVVASFGTGLTGILTRAVRAVVLPDGACPLFSVAPEPVISHRHVYIPLSFLASSHGNDRLQECVASSLGSPL